MWDLVFWPEIEPGPPALAAETQPLDHQGSLSSSFSVHLWVVSFLSLCQKLFFFCMILNHNAPFTSTEASFPVPLWDVKDLPAMWETRAQSLGGEDPQRREWLPTLLFLPGKSYGQRSLVGYSPWGHKELDTTKQLTLWAWHPQPLDGRAHTQFWHPPASLALAHVLSTPVRVSSLFLESEDFPFFGLNSFLYCYISSCVCHTRCRGKVYSIFLVIITGSPDILFITSFPPTNAYDSPLK